MALQVAGENRGGTDSPLARNAFLRYAFAERIVMKLISWNVNGLRAVLRKNFLDYLAEEDPDILCLQETRVGSDEIEQLWPAAYTAYWNMAQKKGYAGTAIFTKKRPLEITTGLGLSRHDSEGRVLTAEFPDFFLVNVYVPNSQRGLTRLPYRQQWDRDFLGYLKRLERRSRSFFAGTSMWRTRKSTWPIREPTPATTGSRLKNGPVSRRSCARVFSMPSVNSKKAAAITRGGAAARRACSEYRLAPRLLSGFRRAPSASERAFHRPDVQGSDHCPVGIELAAAQS